MAWWSANTSAAHNSVTWSGGLRGRGWGGQPGPCWASQPSGRHAAGTRAPGTAAGPHLAPAPPAAGHSCWGPPQQTRPLGGLQRGAGGSGAGPRKWGSPRAGRPWQVWLAEARGPHVCARGAGPQHTRTRHADEPAAKAQPKAASLTRLPDRRNRLHHFCSIHTRQEQHAPRAQRRLRSQSSGRPQRLGFGGRGKPRAQRGAQSASWHPVSWFHVSCLSRVPATPPAQTAAQAPAPAPHPGCHPRPKPARGSPARAGRQVHARRVAHRRQASRHKVDSSSWWGRRGRLAASSPPHLDHLCFHLLMQQPPQALKLVLRESHRQQRLQAGAAGMHEAPVWQLARTTTAWQAARAGPLCARAAPAGQRAPRCCRRGSPSWRHRAASSWRPPPPPPRKAVAPPVPAAAAGCRGCRCGRQTGCQRVLPPPQAQAAAIAPAATTRAGRQLSPAGSSMAALFWGSGRGVGGPHKLPKGWVSPCCGRAVELVNQGEYSIN